MREQCIRAVETALGRPLREAEARDIEGRIQRARLQAARADPAAYRGMSAEEQLSEAGRRAAQELNVEAAKKVQRAEQAILAHDRIERFRNMQVAQGSDTNGVDALERTLVHKYDEKNDGFMSVESRANATFDFAMSRIIDTFEAINPSLWRRVTQGIWRVEPLRKAFVDALHGVDDPSIPPTVRDAAKLYHETADALRQQFNAAGGVIGKLESWGAPHHWSDRILRKVGRDQFVSDMLGWIDRRQYVHDDGAYYTEPELREFFKEAWATIVSDGWTKDATPAAFPGGAVKANRGSHHRVIHLKPEHAYPALRKYADHNILEAMMGGLRRMSRDVALTETYGPNADYQFKLQLNKAITEAARIDPTKAQRLDSRSHYLQHLYDALAGNARPPASKTFSDVMGTIRNVQIAAKLGSAVITSISDYATLYQTALLNRLNPMQVMLNSSLVWGGKSRRFVRRMGLMLDVLHEDAQRYATENLTSKDMSARVASTVMRVSGLGFVTDARRLGFSVTMMDAIGHLTRRYQDVSKLGAADYHILSQKGIRQETWNIWRAAELDTHGANHTLLTPDAIMAVEGVSLEAKRQAAIDLLAIVREEQDLAVIVPGARERVAMTAGTQAGTATGELVRAMMLFKSFPWAFLTRHGERGLSNASAGGRFAYFGALFVNMTLLGVAAQWINDLLTGKDPRNMNVMSEDPHTRSIAVRNWIQGSLKGGALGIYGDFLFSESDPYSGNSAIETLAGPTAGTLGEAQRLTFGNLAQAAEGQETNIGPEALRFARGVTPGANLWFLRGLADRAIWNELSDTMKPGATEELTARVQSQRGQSYWWLPQDNPLAGQAPERAPDMGAGTRAN